ncbi:flagellar protein export ATPase FliI [Desulfallas thermosapovorans]|uniref:Type III secretion system ATPase, FliI/YscN n=1 Tax=Desulfallas thermosapovorans DSM 6562 TaxID=1121431 RepID=A0A5S4ZRE1_9FIRM|nr:flagellar protein export ATPase FliI [Desulfallas thermosapovorans]TYO95484.1 type III secretion system ATPase, FliI/YscN [Desulfallas thermosapovorans DSM 6562]
MQEYIREIQRWRQKVQQVKLVRSTGKVTKVIGLTVEVKGVTAGVGEVCDIIVPGESEPVMAEVVGFQEDSSILMPLGELRGLYPGCLVVPRGESLTVKVGDELLGKVLDGLGRPMNGGGINVQQNFTVNNAPPDPLERKRINEIFTTGVRAIDALLTCGKGQRIGIFAGSGVGKSTLLGMMARFCSADLNVIALIGERGREVLEFIENDLGHEGLARSVVVAATSDQPALVRLKGAFVASAIAEYFRDRGQDVLLFMDSVTRFAMAQREVGLAIGEPPATRGYTPSVFSLLPKLLERSGTARRGTITAFYTVLVEADDMNEPVADAVRGILDGHIVLSRELAARNHYPAIDVLQSVSRLMNDLAGSEHKQLAARLRNLLATYKKSEDLINVGAYARGSNKAIDEAIKFYPKINQFLCQDVNEKSDFNKTIQDLMFLRK